MKNNFFLISVAIGLIIAYFWLENYATPSVQSYGDNNGAIKVRSAEGQSQNTDQSSGAMILGPSAIGPKNGDSGQSLQVPSGGIDQIVGVENIEIE